MKGKTIKQVEKKGCNYWVFHFTDGTKRAIEVEPTEIPNLFEMVEKEAE